MVGAVDIVSVNHARVVPVKSTELSVSAAAEASRVLRAVFLFIANFPFCMIFLSVFERFSFVLLFLDVHSYAPYRLYIAPVWFFQQVIFLQ
jgi:hypothetical protein